MGIGSGSVRGFAATRVAGDGAFSTSSAPVAGCGVSLGADVASTCVATLAVVAPAEIGPSDMLETGCPALCPWASCCAERSSSSNSPRRSRREQQGQKGKTPRASRRGRRHSPFGLDRFVHRLRLNGGKRQNRILNTFGRDRFVHRLRFGGGMRRIGIQVSRIPIGDTGRLALSFCYFATQSWPKLADHLRRGLGWKGALDGEAAIPRIGFAL